MAIKSKQAAYVHGEYVKISDDRDAYVAVIKDLEDGHNELAIIDNPEVPVWVAKPQFRTNTIKREAAPIEELTMYRTRVINMAATLWNAINSPGRWRIPPGYVPLKKMLSSPYVYGADIDYGTHLKMRLDKANGHRTPMSYNVGGLDIETDVNGTNQIILITFMNGDGRTYIGILKEFFLEHTTDEVYTMWSKKVQPEFIQKLNPKSRKIYESMEPITLNIQLFDKELDLIRWIFDKIHECKPDFCGIWNMDYDIPYIIDRLNFRGVDPAQIMCHPDVPRPYRICSYHKDPGKKDGHITDRWSWFNLTDYTRYIDAMCLYGRLRKAKPREPSYRLDAIGGKELGAGKLEFGTGESHSTMQRFHQVEYTVYNIVDVLIMHVMEKRNNDFVNMQMLIGRSTLDTFAHQSIQLKNQWFEYLMPLGYVAAAMGNRIDNPWDKWITNKGGAVLSPDRASIAVPCLQETDVVCRGTRFCCDIDVTAQYPSMTQMLNVAKETKVATLLNIDNTRRRGVVDVDAIKLDPGKYPGLINYDVLDFMQDAIYVKSNVMAVAKKFNLPDFAGIDKWMEEHHTGLSSASRGEVVESHTHMESSYE